MASPNIEELSIHDENEEEGFCFEVNEEGDETSNLRWCLVGRFLSDRPFHVTIMKKRVADVWRPVRGVIIKKATKSLFLFHFDHKLDMESVLNGGPWNFDNNLLIIEMVQLGVQIENIPLNHVEFWVQVHNLPAGLMLERVGITMANFIGSFVEYDKNNNSSFWRQHMRLRVKIDVWKPLKKQTRVKNKGGEWCTVSFKYERLGIFCFVCGILGHTEQRCEVRFAMTKDNGVREWSNELRAENRRINGGQSSKWLKSEKEGGVHVSESGSSKAREEYEPGLESEAETNHEAGPQVLSSQDPHSNKNQIMLKANFNNTDRVLTMYGNNNNSPLIVVTKVIDQAQTKSLTQSLAKNNLAPPLINVVPPLINAVPHWLP
ncbi:unnamed protein product [Lathyrus sativus]|nr:unnamed protein product [Lathyrus sativus]